MHPASTLLLLFAAATTVALIARRFQFPYTVGLVLAGLVLGAAHPNYDIRLTKELLYTVFLPGLVFEAAYHLEFAEFRASARAIFALSVPGVFVATGATAALLVASSHAAGFPTGFGWPQALVFSALIAATDPIAVVSLFKSLGAPKRLRVLMEGESLVNDGTAVVLFTILYTTVTSHERLGAAAGALEFLEVSGLGLIVGGGLAFVASEVIKRVDDSMIEITLTTLTAYGSFVLAERLHASGVIATATAGMACGNYAAPRGMSAKTRVALESFWEYVAFALNSLVFLLIGLEVSVEALLLAWVPVTLAFLAVTLGRAAVVLMVSSLFRRTTERIPWRWSVMLTWGGLRGALSMVLALALPGDFAERQLVVTVTFGVVLLSIVLQGTTAGPLLRALDLAGKATPSVP
jgi:CPA1 family monovalent cation:H+ antiporter